MSAGGQRGTDVSGITSLRIQNASDVTTRQRTRLVYQTFASTTGANAYLNETPNANGSYIDFLTGRKEDCSSCTGLPYQKSFIRTFRT
jgi:hypothetical protein